MTKSSSVLIFILFFLSGFSALIYQVAWQRMLFTRLGGQIESVTIIVSVFMAGLGFGALFGGWLSRLVPGKSLAVFGILEVLTGIYGACSLTLLEWLPHSMIFIAASILFVLPTLMMGATLPLLVSGFAVEMKNAAGAVSILYFVNTLGSAAASVATVFFLLRLFGLSGTVFVAASINIFAGTVVLWKGGLWAK